VFHNLRHSQGLLSMQRCRAFTAFLRCQQLLHNRSNTASKGAEQEHMRQFRNSHGLRGAIPADLLLDNYAFSILLDHNSFVGPSAFRQLLNDNSITPATCSLNRGKLSICQ
jgi:hypothetical protein